MATKQELASYLTNLHHLMEAQEATAVAKSQVLVDEYNKIWGELKTAITEENKPK